MALAFLSYRRGDSGMAAQAIYVQLKVYFGSGQLFMDLNSIDSGAEWPSRIQRNVEQASGMLVLIGDRWLGMADEWGRRRLDLPNDWVAREIRAAFDRKIPVIPVVIGAGVAIPPAEALPPGLKELSSRQTYQIHADSWLIDLNGLARTVANEFHLNIDERIREAVRPYPDPKVVKTPPVSAEDLAKFLAENPGWEPWEDSLPHEYPEKRQELRKPFIFDSFVAATEFMQEAALLFEQQQHHPRWVNEWRLVIIGLTTWDVRNKITDLDIRAAKSIDALYTEFRGRRNKR